MSQIIPINIPTYISDQNYNPSRVLPRLLFYNGLVECEEYYLESGSLTAAGITKAETHFPYFDNYNVISGQFPTTDSDSLLFNNEPAAYGEVPTETLYTTYWEKYINLLYNPQTRLFNCSGIIPLADYFKMQLNNIVQWRGNFYHLRALNNYDLKTGKCDIQLLGPIISEIGFDCNFTFTVSDVGTTTTTTAAPTTTTTTTTAAPTTTTTTTTTTAAPIPVTYVAVAGGGAGGGYRHAGGGGAGGHLNGSANLILNIVYPIVIGAGGVGTSVYNQPPANGNNTTFNSLTLIGGGGGNGSGEQSGGVGAAGGSGGGGAPNAAGGAGTATQGLAGGSGQQISGTYSGGGGGGKGAVGANASSAGGTGGIGSNSFYNGVLTTSPYYAGGGGGGRYASGTAGNGGNGGGGAGAVGSTNAANGTVNTGGGGGGAGGNTSGTSTSGNGGSGIVIIQYAGSPRATGGTIASGGGFTTHTFTASGNFQITS